MRIRELTNNTEVVVRPYASVSSIEEELIRNAYVVIKDEDKFIGILTPSDALASGHNLVIDCYTEKTLINGNEDAENVMNLMLKQGFLVLPVVNDDNQYLGCIQINTMLQKVWDITKQNVSINWVNVLEDGEAETNKQQFSSELFHNTRNPVQVIISAVDMLRSSPGAFESKMLLSSIESNAKLLDTLITKLHAFHFGKGNKDGQCNS
jgi:predicted transcriptional regulator